MAITQLPQQQLEAIHELGKTILASRVALMIGIGIMLADYCALFKPFSMAMPHQHYMTGSEHPHSRDSVLLEWETDNPADIVLSGMSDLGIGLPRSELTDARQIRYANFPIQILNGIGKSTFRSLSLCQLMECRIFQPSLEQGIGL